MEVIEEKVVVGGVTFTKTELKEVGRLCHFTPSGVFLPFKPDTIRNSKTLQKALENRLILTVKKEAPLVVTTDFASALKLYR